MEMPLYIDKYLYLLSLSQTQTQSYSYLKNQTLMPKYFSCGAVMQEFIKWFRCSPRKALVSSEVKIFGMAYRNCGIHWSYRSLWLFFFLYIETKVVICYRIVAAVLNIASIKQLNPEHLYVKAKFQWYWNWIYFLASASLLFHQWT